MTILMALGGWFVLSVVVGCRLGMMIRTADAEECGIVAVPSRADMPALCAIE